MDQVTYLKLDHIPDDISKYSNLRILDCSNNYIRNFPNSLFELTKLEELNISNNRFTQIPSEISQLKSLRVLNCAGNQLTNLPNEINQLYNLTAIICSNNDIKSLFDDFGSLKNLLLLNCSYNKIKKLPKNISNTNLNILDITYNCIKKLPKDISNLNTLQKVYLNSNPINVVPPNIRALVSAQKNTSFSHSIYNSTQTVHDSTVQQGVRNSVKYILSVAPIITFDQLNELIMANNILSPVSKQLLFEFMESNNIHSGLNTSFKQLLLHTYSIILARPDMNSIFGILDQEVRDADCKCFTGRISRLVNCLSGFDGNIKIGISLNEQISNVIIQIKKKFEAIPNCEKELKLEIFNELKSMDIDEKTINEWIVYV